MHTFRRTVKDGTGAAAVSELGGRVGGRNAATAGLWGRLLRVFELLAPAGELAPGLAELRGVFAEGLDAYRAMKREVAADRFRACLAMRPDDGPARAFLERVTLLAAHPPAADWHGVWSDGQK